MSAIGHFLEDEGIATASVSLIRMHTEVMRPPRALWVPFELGRPLGAPHEAGLQTRVLQSLLGLFERADGPVILADFAEDAPKIGDQEMAGMFCPLPAQQSATGKSGNLIDRVREQMDVLSPWYELAMGRNNGRTTVGANSMSIDASLEFLGALIYDNTIQTRADKSPGQTMRLAAEDLRAWFTEARIAQPSANPDSALLANWFWGETAAGQFLLTLHSTAIAHADATVRFEAKHTLIPRNQQYRLNAVDD